MMRTDLELLLRDQERGDEVALTLVQRDRVSPGTWRMIIRHQPFGKWRQAVAATPSFPEDPIIVEYALRHLREGETRVAVLEAAIRHGHPEHAAEWWRELAAAAPERATTILVDLPQHRRQGLTQGDLDSARVWGRLPAVEAAMLRAEIAAGLAVARVDRWRPIALGRREVPADLRTLGDVCAWPTNADQAEAVITVLRGQDVIRHWAKSEILDWSRELLTEAVVTELLNATTTTGRDLLATYPDDRVVASWVLGWALDAWRGKYALANHSVEKVATELVVDALARFAVTHGTRLWRDLVDVAARQYGWPVARAAMYTVLTHPEVTNEDLDWLSFGQDRGDHEEWREAIALHPVRTMAVGRPATTP